MRQYIINLTDHLIGRYNLEQAFGRRKDKETFIEDVKFVLDVDAVGEMTGQRLGHIMSSFEVGDVPATQAELMRYVSFAGDCDGFLRQIVSTSLAYTIEARLSHDESVPAYASRRVKMRTGGIPDASRYQTPEDTPDRLMHGR